MKKKSIFAAIFVVSLVLGGCAASRPAAAPEQAILVRIQPTSPVGLSQVQALRRDGRVLVSGRVNRPAPIHLPGHVDVLFLRPDGSTLFAQQIDVVGLHSMRHGRQEIPFAAAVDGELPADARAVFSYHAPPF
ncbi:MAG: hypothetical protein WDA20_02805 [Desulfuromonadales bacterium]|jgi:hypothetical protein